MTAYPPSGSSSDRRVSISGWSCASISDTRPVILPEQPAVQSRPLPKDCQPDVVRRHLACSNAEQDWVLDRGPIPLIFRALALANTECQTPVNPQLRTV